MTRLSIGMTTLASTAWMLAGAAALAQTSEQANESPDKPTFESLDKDSDRQVSLNEAAENDAVFVAFEGLDKNRDGELTRQEFAVYERERGT